jgi:two-component system, cell cycle sensor histidine kinase and response regulator CckA
LRANEKEWLALLEVLPVGVSILDEHQAIKTFNPALGAILGLTGEGLQDGVYRQRRYLRSDGTPMPPEEFPSVRAQREQQTIRAVPIGVIKDDGSTAWTEVSAAPLSLPNASCVTVTTDITEKKRAAEALHESEEIFRMLFQSVNDALFVSELDDQGMLGQFILVNDTACQRLGYSRKELLARTPADINSDHSRPSFNARIRKILAERCAIVESEHVTKDGRIIPVEISTSVATLRNKTVFCSLARDITERKQAETALMQSEALMRTAIENLPLIFYMIDSEGIFRLSVGAGLKGLGLEQNQVCGLSAFEIYRDFPEITDAIRKALAGNAATFESRVSGSSYSNICVPFRASNTRFSGLVAVALDITERKTAEEQNARIEGQLHQAQKMEAVGRLAGGVAHDFNNMLGAILGHVELAIAEVDSTQSLYADLREIQSAARRCTDLTRQLLAFARKQTVAPKVLDLNQTVEGMLKMLRRLIGEGIDFSFQPATDLWSIKMDPSQIDQILANLCVNARDAIADIGEITIETKNSNFDEDYCANHAGYVAGDYVQLAVSDDGNGMDEATQGRLFEPFFTTKELGKGTGLGLSTVYGIVEQNGGFINVYSEPGHGTTFKIYLPREPLPAVRMTKSSSRATAAPVGNETILVVEDERALRDVIKRILVAAGYTVLVAWWQQMATKR